MSAVLAKQSLKEFGWICNDKLLVSSRRTLNTESYTLSSGRTLGFASIFETARLNTCTFSPLQDYEFPVQSDDSRQETVRDQFRAELRTLSSLGLPYVGFLLQHEYTQTGAVKEVCTTCHVTYIWRPQSSCGIHIDSEGSCAVHEGPHRSMKT